MIRAIVSAILALLPLNEAKALHHAVATKGNVTSSAAIIPLPRARLPMLQAQSASSTSETGAPLSSAELSSCFAGLVPAGAVAERQDPIVGPGLCGASDLVRLKAIRLIDGRLVALHPPPSCAVGCARRAAALLLRLDHADESTKPARACQGDPHHRADLELSAAFRRQLITAANRERRQFIATFAGPAGARCVALSVRPSHEPFAPRGTAVST